MSSSFGKCRYSKWLSAISLLIALALASEAHAVPVKVTIQNLAPESGTFLTPMWVGFHTGVFDLYDLGAPASPEMERLAEDGNTSPLSAAFAAAAPTGVDGTIAGLSGAAGPIDPGETTSAVFDLDPAANQFLSYASMVIPSNDAFIANGNPLAFPIFDAGGNFVGIDFIVLGTQVLDAGTEVNDELPANTAFFGQATPDTGTDENGVVSIHSGFLPSGNGGILDDPNFANGDFRAPGYQIARITVTQVPLPEPASLALLVAGLVLLMLYSGTTRTISSFRTSS